MLLFPLRPDYNRLDDALRLNIYEGGRVFRVAGSGVQSVLKVDTIDTSILAEEREVLRLTIDRRYL